MATKQGIGARLHAAANGGLGTAEPGTAPHGLLLLVIAEVVALVWLRRAFRSAHGG